MSDITIEEAARVVLSRHGRVSADAVKELHDETGMGMCECKNVLTALRTSVIELENAKLRTFLGGGSIVTDYWKDEDGTMHVLTTDGEHTYEYMRGGLADENAKLRELVTDYFNAPCVTCDPWGDGFRCTHCESGNCTLAIRTLELGIEVDG